MLTTFITTWTTKARHFMVYMKAYPITTTYWWVEVVSLPNLLNCSSNPWPGWYFVVARAQTENSQGSYSGSDSILWLWDIPAPPTVSIYRPTWDSLHTQGTLPPFWLVYPPWCYQAHKEDKKCSPYILINTAMLTSDKVSGHFYMDL